MGWPSASLACCKPVKERGDVRYPLPLGMRQGFVVLRESIRIGSIHTALILGRLARNAVGLESLESQ